MAKRVPANVCPRPGAVKFFERNAGGNRMPGESRRRGQIRSARALAVAECVADREGARVDWEFDQMPYDPGDVTDYTPDEVLCAVLRSADGDVRNSLCGIADPDRNYRRVIEAELAVDAFADEIEPIERQLETRRGRPVRLGLFGLGRRR